MRQLPKSKDSRLIVGYEGSDDAAVYKLDEEMAIIETLDFFTPIVDDPYLFGQIAAANALSDIYAMGADPILAMNIVCFPCHLPMEVLTLILKGGAHKVHEAGAIIVGGHTIDDKEPKYGLSVTGRAHPDKIWANKGAKNGDVLVMTKALGLGILATAERGDLLTASQAMSLHDTMSMLNKYAADEVKKEKITVRAATDITGFGLIGHVLEMLSDDQYAVLEINKIPFLNGTKEMADIGIIPAGAYKNEAAFKDQVMISGEVDESLQLALYDPQTSGGLIFAVPAEDALILAQNKNSDFKIIGKIGEGLSGKKIKVIYE